MKVYLNKEYKCVKVEDNTFVANDSSNYIRYYFVTNANGDVIDKMDDTSVIYRNTEPSYVTVAFRRADGDVIQHLMASPKTDATGKSFFEYEITNTDGVLYKKGALEISAQFIEATLSEAGGVKKVISQKVKAVAINTAHVLDNIGEEAEEYYSQYEQANNDAHAALQTEITTNFNNIGTLQELTTDAKDDLVKAINEVDAHADANKSEIGDLSNLTTDEKTTIVGAINEVDAHSDANKTEMGNLSALTTDEKATLVGAINEVDNHADNAIGLANNAVATANSAVATANEAKTTAQTAENNANSAVDKATEAQRKAQEAITKAENNVYAVGFMTLQEAITAVNGYDNTVLKTNDNILVVAQGSPDLYVTSVEATNIPYNFTTVDKFNDDLVKNTVLQIGYYKVAFYETDGQPVTVAYQNVVVKSTDWVASTEFADFPYEAKIPLSNFVDYKTVPQVVFDIADTMSGNYAPICKSGDKCVYIYGKVQNEITLKTVITFAPNVNGASVTGGGYNNRGKWVASTTYAIDDLVYTDNGQYVCIEGITSTTSPEQDTTHWQATFVATGTVPEALPQEASALKSGNLPTSGWISTSPLIGSYKAINAYHFNNFGFIEGNKYTITYKLKTSSALKTETVTAVTRNYLSNPAVYTVGIAFEGGDFYVEDGIFWYVQNNGFEIDRTITNQASLRCYKDVEIINITEDLSNTVYHYTISDTSITTNSDILMELTDEGGVKSYSMEAGKITVIRDTVPTQPIPYTYKVKQTNASGQFTLVNHFVPSIPENPTSLPVTYKKVSGELPTSGWTATVLPLWEGNFSKGASSGESIILPAGSLDFNKLKQYTNTTDWQIWTDYAHTSNTYQTPRYANAFSDEIRIGSDQISFKIKPDGSLYAYNQGSSSVTFKGLKCLANSQYTFSISDTDITANSSVKMYLTDEVGVKAYSKAVGSIQVIRDTVPTTAIPYEYEVEQTSAEGLFDVINAYVPTKTSELTNDSGFITAADIPTVGEWVDVTGETATLTQAGTYQVLFGSSNSVQSIIYWDGTNGADGIYSTMPSVTSGRPFINCRYPHITAAGVLSINYDTITEENGTWTKTTSTLSGFKYRKIN